MSAESAMDAAMEKRKQRTRFQHDHPRCESCRITEVAWQDCIVALDRERNYVKRLEHALVLAHEEALSIYQSLPTRRNKWAKRLLNLGLGQVPAQPPSTPPHDIDAHGYCWTHEAYDCGAHHYERTKRSRARRKE